MSELLNIITPLHKKAERDYIGRMNDNKVECMKIAKKYGREFWDGDRRYGYGGYKYDGRYKPIAEKLIEKYNIPEHGKIIDIGCAKGFLLYEFKKILPECEISGMDISRYAVDNAKEEVRPDLFIHKAQEPYKFKDNEFDLVLSLGTLHNLMIYELKSALREIERVGKNKYIVVESYRNDNELFNLQCWALTCSLFLTPDQWIWLFKEWGYTGDYEFIYFE